jgi:hypothetical protein
MCGQPEQAVFAHFFMFFFVGSQPETDLISYRGQSEMKNARKKSVFTVSVALRRSNFLWPGQGVTMNFFEEAKE